MCLLYEKEFIIWTNFEILSTKTIDKVKGFLQTIRTQLTHMD